MSDQRRNRILLEIRETNLAAQLFFRDIEGGAACCVLTRPVRRWEYLAGKFAGVAGLLALFTAALGLLLASFYAAMKK